MNRKGRCGVPAAARTETTPTPHRPPPEGAGGKRSGQFMLFLPLRLFVSSVGKEMLPWFLNFNRTPRLHTLFATKKQGRALVRNTCLAFTAVV